ncbi:hypothetical protein [Leifsonia sp. NPDC058230]|uniref:hypothetical protein n=1 Tax=Leifsonia sp. NPDC058230 TaxID=3346391 RepID=UPI0036D8DB09
MTEEDARAQVGGVLAAFAQGRPGDAKLLLHPYLHWTTPSGDTVRGRANVLALLSELAATDAALPEPESVELRDGQIYRWLSA